jgi:hypothetical protein
MSLKRVLNFKKDTDSYTLEIIVPSIGHCEAIKRNNNQLFKNDKIKFTVLEGRITDEIIDLCTVNRIDLYERTNDDSPESVLIEYLRDTIEQETAWVVLYADEMILDDSLHRLQGFQTGAIYVDRYEFFYGINSRTFFRQIRGGSGTMRKILIDSLKYKNSIHDFWEVKTEKSLSSFILPVGHMHEYVMADDYGKGGRYVVRELEVILNHRFRKALFFKRFGLRILRRFLNIKLLIRQKEIYFFLLSAQIIESFLALMFILEIQMKNQRDSLEEKSLGNGNTKF